MNKEIDTKITIVEGPPPTFRPVNEVWAFGLNESPILYNVVVTQLRTFNGPSLIERCHRAWRHMFPMHLEYRLPDGLETRAPILAARNVEVPEGHLLLLWLQVPKEEANPGFDLDDSAN